jgi:hypothetical protein
MSSIGSAALVRSAKVKPSMPENSIRLTLLLPSHHLLGCHVCSFLMCGLCYWRGNILRRDLPREILSAISCSSS